MPINPSSAGYCLDPGLQDKIHCVVFVLNACSLHSYGESLLKMIKKFHREISDLGELFYYFVILCSLKWSTNTTFEMLLWQMWHNQIWRGIHCARAYLGFCGDYLTVTSCRGDNVVFAFPSLDVPQLVLLTHVDEVCHAVNMDVRYVYTSRIVQKKVWPIPTEVTGFHSLLLPLLHYSILWPSSFSFHHKWQLLNNEDDIFNNFEVLHPCTKHYSCPAV